MTFKTANFNRLTFQTTCLTLGMLVFGLISHAQTVNYLPSSEDFMNPDRGFYFPTQTDASNFVPLDLADLVSRRTLPYTPWQANYQVRTSLVYRNYVLDAFVNTDNLSTNFLNLMEQDFITARQAGVRLILRYCYTVTPDSSCSLDFCAPYGDAPKSRVLSHIADIKDVLQNYSDVISVVQSGFIGIWGEQYYTDYFGDASVQGKLFNTNWEDRADVVTALLDAVPSNRMVQVRYPQMKQKFLFGPEAPVSSPAMTAAQAHDGSMISRLAFHNDCFLSSPNDVGTYIDYGSDSTPSSDQTSVLKPYSAADGKFVAVGGETCADGFDPQNNCSGQAVSDMDLLHYSFLNAFYNNAVNNDWEDGACMDEIKQKLGYRIEMIDGTYPSAANIGTPFNFILNLENIGFSAPFNEKQIELVLRETSTNQIHTIPFSSPSADVRFWFTGLINLQESITLPSSIPEGNYNLLLHILDPSNQNQVAARPEYSIRLANSNTWEASTGYNDLNHILAVTTNTTTTHCITVNGDFQDWSSVPSLNSTGSSGLATLHAADQADSLVFFVEGQMADNFQFYLDSDYDAIGTNEFMSSYWPASGINYLIENGSIYQYTGTGINWSWNYIGDAYFSQTATGIELSIQKNLIPFIGSQIGIGFANLNSSFTNIGQIPSGTVAANYTLLTSLIVCACNNDDFYLSGNLTIDTEYGTNGLIETNQLLGNGITVNYHSAISVEFGLGFSTNGSMMHGYILGCN